MKKKLIPVLAIAALTSCFMACSNNHETAQLNNERDSLSWAMGMSLAQTAQSDFYNFDKEVVTKAFESYLNGEKQPLTTDQYNEACEQIAQLASLASHASNKKQSEAGAQKQEKLFEQLLAQNPDIQKAPQGFYYQVLRPGKGPKATIGKRLKFDFKGTNLFTGELIEQTYGRRDPVIHTLGSPMFEGLIEGFQLMNAGSQFRFYFPFEKVVGASGIPPYTPVVYEVELHEIFND